MWNFAYIGPAQTAEEALERLAQHHDFIAVDTETIALKGDKAVEIPDWDEVGNITPRKDFLDAKTMIGIGIAISPTEGFYFPRGQEGWKNVPMCDTYPAVRAIADESQCKIFFNSAFDLARIYDAWGVEVKNFHDTAIASQVQGLWNSLAQNAGHLTGETHTEIDDVLPKGKTMLDLEFRTTAFKCICDCFTTFNLFELYKMRQWEKRESFTWTDHVSRQFDVNPGIIDCYFVDLKLIPVLLKMSRRGIKVRPDVVKKWWMKLSSELRNYDDYFKQQGINPGSNDQVGKLLADRGNWMPLTESKKHLKVNEDILLGMKDPVAHMVLARRRRAKLRGTYIAPNIVFDSQGKIIGWQERQWTNYRLDLATGRLGSFDFNAQNQPPSMREVYDTDSGDPWSWMDLHQAEMRVWAYQAKDEVMLEAFRQNQSPHVVTLKALFPGVPKTAHRNGPECRDGTCSCPSSVQYTDSKSFNFALLADASDSILARTTKRPEWEVAKLKAEMYALYWRSVEHQNFMRPRKRPDGYPDWVEDDFGRRCHIPDNPMATDTHKEKCRLNYPFQATVASIIKRIMLGLDAMGFDYPFQVHDEIVTDGDVEYPKWIEHIHPAIPMPFEVNKNRVWV